jgi:hypothetical protein
VKLLRAVLLGFAVALLCGAAPAWAADLDFEPVPLGTTPDVQELELVNDGGEDITLRPATIVGVDAGSFAIEEDLCKRVWLWPGEGCTVRVRFGPQRMGPNQATLQIPIDGSPEPVTATLAGEGRQSVRVSPGAIDFGTTSDVSPRRDVVVQNVSDETLSGLGGWWATPRSIWATNPLACSQPLPPGGTCTLPVAATGRDLGTFTNTLQVQRGSVVLASVPVRITRVARTAPPPKPAPTADATAMVKADLAGALKSWRKLGRRALRKRGFAITDFEAPADGMAYLLVRSGKRIVAQDVFFVDAGKPAKLRARATRAGRRLLAAKKTKQLDVVLRYVATSDSRVSRAQARLRL